ncbi:MAG: SUMF1/EgtB/PvdO family nonheme iron enzyme [Frankia sp.]
MWACSSNRPRNGAPAVDVDWHQCSNSVTRLSETDSENSYYLPTEKEWGYAARAKTESNFSFGDDAQNAEKYAHKGWH